MTRKTMLMLMILSILLTVCFPAGALEPQTEKTPERELPASFDLRNVDTDGDGVGDRCYVTPVRFQNPFATCWVFAAIGAAETSLLGSVYADDPEAWKTLDLSEKQLGYFSHVLLNDPSSPQHGEGQTAADPTNMFDLYGGGSTAMAIWALAQGIGPSDEHPDLPDIGDLFEYHGRERITVLDYIDGAYRGFHYSDEDDWTIPDQFRFHQDYVLTDTHLLPSPAQWAGPEEYVYNEAGTEAIKRQLLEKRGVMINLTADESSPNQEESGETKYISDKWAHYTWNSSSSNHAVTLIGWDDHYPRENFLAEHQPPADGAWLAKNSWGSAEEAFPSYASGNWGIENEEGRNTGYFWVSYYDHSISDPIALELKAATAPQSVDQHDYFLPISLRSVPYVRTASMANVFRADHSKTIRTVSCMTASANTSVHYQIYLLQDDYQTPEDGLLVTEGDASFTDAGFHRIPVSGIRVQKGQYFSVVETLTNQEGTYDVLVSSTYGFGEDTQKAIVNERESYLFQEGQWQDYRTVLDARAEEEAKAQYSLGISYDNFPIKVFSDRDANDVRMKLKFGSRSLSLLEGLDSSTYSLRFVVNNGFDVVQVLVEAGADVNACGTGRFHESVLHSAIWTKDPRVIQLLLERGADPYALNSVGWTPLHLAAFHVRGHEIIDPIIASMKPVPAAPAKRYKGTLEYVDSWNRRAYQLVDGTLVEHNLRRVGPGMFLGDLVVVQYHASTKSKASVENLTLKAADEANPPKKL